MTNLHQAEEVHAASLPDDMHLLELGDHLLRHGRLDEAEACFKKVVHDRSHNARAYSSLGWINESRGDNVSAISYYKNALQINSRLGAIRCALTKLLIQLGSVEEIFQLWNSETSSAELDRLISSAMLERNLGPAGVYAAVVAGLRWGSQWYPKLLLKSVVPASPPDASLTIPKLRHDIEQFQYLQNKGILNEEFTPIITEYQEVIDRLETSGPDARMLLDDETRLKIGHVYNRIVHVRHTPRVQHALSRAWDAVAVESHYLRLPPGLVVIDKFLSDEALESIRLFCLESTIWSSNRHAHGRIGSQFRNGFSCPLLMQIGEEIRDAFPRVIGNHYPLRHIWGYKSPPTLSEDSTIHADFAAVNVNIWITPDVANLDDTSGGLVVYGVDAPLHWDFNMYNARLEDVIKPFLRRQHARAVTIPYRQNRAVIFNSDLFHSTARLNFRPGYENQRINITMLYGDRENDIHHRGLAGPEVLAMPSSMSVNAWRSAAFTSFRGRKGYS